MLYVSVQSEIVHFCIRSFILAKTSFMLVCSKYIIIHDMCVIRDGVFNDFDISFLCLFGIIVYVS